MAKTKLIVKTKGHFSIMNLNGEHISPGRPGVVTDTAIMREKFSDGHIVILARDLDDSANDADFARVYEDAKGDVELAVAVYVSMLKGNPV